MSKNLVEYKDPGSLPDIQKTMVYDYFNPTLVIPPGRCDLFKTYMDGLHELFSAQLFIDRRKFDLIDQNYFVSDGWFYHDGKYYQERVRNRFLYFPLNNQYTINATLYKLDCIKMEQIIHIRGEIVDKETFEYEKREKMYEIELKRYENLSWWKKLWNNK